MPKQSKLKTPKTGDVDLAPVAQGPGSPAARMVKAGRRRAEANAVFELLREVPLSRRDRRRVDQVLAEVR